MRGERGRGFNAGKRHKSNGASGRASPNFDRDGFLSFCKADELKPICTKSLLSSVGICSVWWGYALYGGGLLCTVGACSHRYQFYNQSC